MSYKIKDRQTGDLFTELFPFGGKLNQHILQYVRRNIEQLKKLITSAAPISIVSFHRPNVRPIVRGKSGKEVEFGPKASVRLVDGYLFLDKFSNDAYNEGSVLSESLNLHEDRFGRKPETVITCLRADTHRQMDKIYGSKTNREMLIEKWVKQKQRKRNAIEGKIGVSKVHRGLAKMKS